VRIPRVVPTACLSAALLSPAVLLAARQDTAKQDTTKQEPGQKILDAACLDCHDMRNVDTQALDEKEWTDEVKSMIRKGAEVKTEDIPVLVDYLVKYHGPLPDGPGKDEVLHICTQCHDLTRVKRTKLSAEGWAEIMQAMLNEGAPITDKDFPVILRYLAKNFRP